MSRHLPLAVFVLLVACGTPQERCINGATRDLRIVNRLIAETETNLARGYSLEDVVIYRTVWVYCDDAVIVVQPDGSKTIERSTRMCLDDREETIQRPRAIDPAAEKSKLKGLKDRNAALTKQARPAIAQCRAQHPE